MVLAHMLALESPLVQVEMVEATKFPEFSGKFGVSGVPYTTINNSNGNMVGAVPEANLLAEILRSVAPKCQ